MGFSVGWAIGTVMFPEEFKVQRISAITRRKEIMR